MVNVGFTIYDVRFFGGGCKLLLLIIEIGLSFYFTQITQIGYADYADLSVHEFALINTNYALRAIENSKR